jgi:hypothetical protein
VKATERIKVIDLSIKIQSSVPLLKAGDISRIKRLVKIEGRTESVCGKKNYRFVSQRLLGQIFRVRVRIEFRIEPISDLPRRGRTKIFEQEREAWDASVADLFNFVLRDPHIRSQGLSFLILRNSDLFLGRVSLSGGLFDSCDCGIEREARDDGAGYSSNERHRAYSKRDIVGSFLMSPVVALFSAMVFFVGIPSWCFGYNRRTAVARYIAGILGRAIVPSGLLFTSFVHAESAPTLFWYLSLFLIFSAKLSRLRGARHQVDPCHLDIKCSPCPSRTGPCSIFQSGQSIGNSRIALIPFRAQSPLFTGVDSGRGVRPTAGQWVRARYDDLGEGALPCFANRAWRIQMPLSRHVVSLVWMFLGLSTASAQTGGALPLCSQRMLVGTWQAVFNTGAGFYQNFVCPVSISSNGTLAAGTCTFFANVTASELPSGSLLIDRSCLVTGLINYTTSNPSQLSVSLWRSADGSRLSGFAEICVAPCSINPGNAIPFEMIKQ